MAFQRKFNKSAQTSLNTGFGDNASNYGGRFINKGGKANIRKVGLRLFEQYSWFHSMLAISWLHFFLLMLLFFIAVNLGFATIYYFLGEEHLVGMHTNSEAQKFSEAFFFSAQTFTTVGYGRISPSGFITSAISSFQALMGLLSFAVATGLMYGRFSKPTAYLKYSANALISPFKGSTALMFRIAPFKNATLTDAEVQATLALRVEEDNKFSNRFFPLELELSKINALNLSWTVVHPINDKSAFYQLSEEDIQNMKGEILIFIKVFDDMFSNIVVSRTSYLFREIIYGAKFSPMYHRDESNTVTILDLEKINAFERTNLPATS